MSFPNPDDYSDWRAYSRALVQLLNDTGVDFGVSSQNRVIAPPGSGGGGGGTGTYPPNYGPVWLNQADAELYLGNAAFDPPVAANLFEIDTTNLVNLAITTAKLKDEAVITSKILAGAVTELKLADEAVSSAKIATAAVTSSKIVDEAVSEVKIAIDAITNSKIANNAVSSAKIVDAAIVTAKIGDLAVITAKIGDLAVNSSKIANLTVGSAQIGDAAIVEVKIGNAAVSTAKIQDAAIISAKIGFASILTAHIADASIITAKIADATITTALIGDAAVVTAKINDLAVNSSKIANLAVTSAKIANLAVGVAHIQAAAVGTAQIIDGSIINAKIGNVIQSDNYNDTTKLGWKIDKSGNISGRGIIIYNPDGSVAFASGNPIAASNISGLGTLSALNSVEWTNHILGRPAVAERFYDFVYANVAALEKDFTVSGQYSLIPTTDTGGKALKLGTGTGAVGSDFTYIIGTEFISYLPDTLWEIVFDLEITASSSNAFLYAGVACLDNNNNNLGTIYNYVAAVGIAQNTVIGRNTYKAYLKGFAPIIAQHASGTADAPVPLPDGSVSGFGAGGVVKFAPVILANYSGTGDTTGSVIVHAIRVTKLSGALSAQNTVAFNSAYTTGFGLLAGLNALSYGSGYLSGFGALAGFNSLANGSAYLTGFGAIASQNVLDYSSGYLTGLGVLAAQNTVNLGTQTTGSITTSQVSGLGSLATANSISLPTQSTGAIPLSRVSDAGQLAALNVLSYGSSYLTGFGQLAALSSVAYGSAYTTGFGVLAAVNTVDINSQVTGNIALARVAGAGSFAALNLLTAGNISTYISGAAIGSALIANAAIGTAQIDNLAVTSAKIANAAIGSAQIADASIVSAKIVSLLVDQISSGNLNAVINVGGGRFQFTVGSNTLVLGNGFGSSNQFFLWYGPTQSSLSAYTEALAVVYLKTNGSAYFGGTLSTGVLKAAVNGTSLASNASITTGDYGSNGGSINVVLSYSWSAYTTKIYDANNAGLAEYNTDVTAFGGSGSPNNFTGSIAEAGTVVADLNRSVGGGSFANVATLTVSGGTRTMVGTKPVPGDAAGNATFTQAFGGSITYTDTLASTSNRNYQAIITTNTIVRLSTGQTQSLAITSTEG